MVRRIDCNFGKAVVDGIYEVVDVEERGNIFLKGHGDHCYMRSKFVLAYPREVLEEVF